jgi:hypothetical protein
MMSQSLQSRIYQTPAWIQWCVDAKQVIVVDQSIGKSFTLRGLQASIWNWLTLGYERSRITEFVSITQNQTLVKSDQLVVSTVSDWIANGLLVEK